MYKKHYWSLFGCCWVIIMRNIYFFSSLILSQQLWRDEDSTFDFKERYTPFTLSYITNNFHFCIFVDSFCHNFFIIFFSTTSIRWDIEHSTSNKIVLMSHLLKYGQIDNSCCHYFSWQPTRFINVRSKSFERSLDV